MEESEPAASTAALASDSENNVLETAKGAATRAGDVRLRLGMFGSKRCQCSSLLWSDNSADSSGV